jgi:lipoprotein-releasing system permease protein
MIWSLAAKNALAGRDRSLLVVASLALASFVLVVGSSLASSLARNVELGIRRGYGGDLQVFHASNRPLGFTEEVPSGWIPVADAERVERILREDADVASVAARAQASGLALVGPSSAPVVLVGLDAAAESAAIERLQTAGGRFAERGGALLGRPLAERLGVGEGEEITVLIPTDDGLFEGGVFAVTGFYASAGLPLIDQFVAFVPYDDLQELTRAGAPSSLVVRLGDGADPSTVRARLARAVERDGVPVTLWTWEELAGDLLGIARAGRYLTGSAMLFLLLIVALGVGNLWLVSTLERTRDIGVMRALGTPRRRVVATILAETFLISATASVAGAAAGGLVIAACGRAGIPAASEAMIHAFGGPRLHPAAGVADLLLGILVVTAAGTLAAFVPALVASATEPAAAMRSPA